MANMIESFSQDLKTKVQLAEEELSRLKYFGEQTEEEMTGRIIALIEEREAERRKYETSIIELQDRISRKVAEHAKCEVALGGSSTSSSAFVTERHTTCPKEATGSHHTVDGYSYVSKIPERHDHIGDAYPQADGTSDEHLAQTAIDTDSSEDDAYDYLERWPSIVCRKDKVWVEMRCYLCHGNSLHSGGKRFAKGVNGMYYHISKSHGVRGQNQISEWVVQKCETRVVPHDELVALSEGLNGVSIPKVPFQTTRAPGGSRAKQASIRERSKILSAPQSGKRSLDNSDLAEGPILTSHQQNTKCPRLTRGSSETSDSVIANVSAYSPSLSVSAFGVVDSPGRMVRMEPNRYTAHWEISKSR